MPLQVGYAYREITPAPGVTLSGFAARCNRPSTGVDDPLHVHALACAQEGQAVLWLVFDLLALGSELTEQLHVALDEAIAIPRANRIFCCTHTHSAPATITLIGCGIPDPRYWDHLCCLATDAAREAGGASRPAEIRTAAVSLPDASYNRCSILDDGRVAMSMHPDAPVVKSGPIIPIMRLIRFDEPDGRPIAALAQWAAHPVTVCSQQISADYPGELCRRLSARFGLPFLYLQGAAGNINVPFEHMTREEMLRNTDGIMDRVANIEWGNAIASTPFTFATKQVPLRYAPSMKPAELAAMRDGMGLIADTGHGPEATEAMLANILNVAPGEQPPSDLLRHIAGSLQEWSARTLNKMAERQSEIYELHTAVLRVGKLVWCVVAAEPFSETAIALQTAAPDDIVMLVGYAAPLVGYLPTAEALAAGGYESESAYRFYGHPAPFATESEQIVREALREMVACSGARALGA